MSVSIAASPATIVKGNPATLTVTAANATQVVISDNQDSTTYTLTGSGEPAAGQPDGNHDLHGDGHQWKRHRDSDGYRDGQCRG